VPNETKSEPFRRPSQAQEDANLHLGFVRIFVLNVIVFCSLFVSLEFSYRAWLYFQDCHTGCYNSAFLTKFDTFNRTTRVYGFLAPNPVTGYSPTHGTFVIREPGWNDATITLRQGVRANPNFAPPSDSSILAVGDSMVFGDQVSDDETWPAILERRLNRQVVNGGVSGYGTAQALLRAEQLFSAKSYSLVILSTLVPADLWRDRYVNAYDRFYRPAVIRENNEIRHATIEESRRIASENFICTHSWIPELFFWSYIAERFFSGLGYDGRCTAVIHPQAATFPEILEFVVKRFTTFPVKKAILLQYSRASFDGSADEVTAIKTEARRIRDLASAYGVPVIDTYDTLKTRPLNQIYVESSWWPHHSKVGNELVAESIVRHSAVLAPCHEKLACTADELGIRTVTAPVAIDEVKARLATESRAEGFVERIARTEQSLIVSGWAADSATKSPVVAIHVFVGHDVGVAIPTVPRGDVEKALNVGTSASNLFGFHIVAPVGAAYREDVHVFAQLRDGSFAALPLLRP
jgi:hypothetical protein